jgi:alkanesulfonate monooxygenase SsuD/methylene tetrahydromethanopterin reductase-like flavin-dependent oxidoreductase (luciferase family)
MDVGIQMVLATYGWQGMSDDQAWDEEIRLARLADELGFDALWAVEHHFNDYSFCPDNLQLMAYLAAVCPNIDLGTAAVILPWNDPLRVAEKAIVLDMLSKGRLRLGIGRGLARREFAAFRQTMEESRERFDESAAMILEALRTGWMEGNGKYYKQPRIELRPRPRYSFEGRIYAVAASDDSVDACARLGARMVMFADRPWPLRMPAINRHRELTRQYHGREALPMLIADFCVCWHDLAEAEDLSRRHMGSFVQSNVEHYELMSDHFSTVKGYDAYAQKSEIVRNLGLEGMTEGFLKAAVLGYARPHPANARRAPGRRRQFRARHLVPLRWHSVPGRGEIDAALRQGSPSGIAVLADPGHAGGGRAGSGGIDARSPSRPADPDHRSRLRNRAGNR